MAPYARLAKNYWRVQQLLILLSPQGIIDTAMGIYKAFGHQLSDGTRKMTLLVMDMGKAEALKEQGNVTSAQRPFLKTERVYQCIHGVDICASTKC
ncbi:unnamed protein product [Vitrella brassicaformis CCMP3155]|uniref:Uncharacterized protein n=1 Tax=Vitrella brassicaformis (strain CCMP3155) TaxID=1169540 RepID=A0A0G4FQQ6_VITBC|nr:unnamed protein product [Vitrella brassicaformis CCMP3155]|eukprot:CEM16406.1 unnamed protein product [Vitrella brassicaformis CCMP3155]